MVFLSSTSKTDTPTICHTRIPVHARNIVSKRQSMILTNNEGKLKQTDEHKKSRKMLQYWVSAVYCMVERNNKHPDLSITSL